MALFKYLVTGAFLCTLTLSWSQQESLFTQFTEQMILLNPAYAGVNNQSMIAFSVRSQWSGIEDAPEVQLFSFSTCLGKNVGFGVSMMREKTFIERQHFVGLDLSYKINITAATALYFGVKAGGNFYDLNVNGLNTFNPVQDPALASISHFTPNVGMGLYVKNKKWYLSLSAPRLFGSDSVGYENGMATASLIKPHLYAAVGMDLVLNKKETLFLQPALLVRYVNGFPVTVDVNTMVSFNNTFKIGATYRTGMAYAGMASIAIMKKFSIGFSYEMNARTQLAKANNTNELLVKYTF